MYCKHCGRRVFREDRVCPYCGSLLSREPEQADDNGEEAERKKNPVPAICIGAAVCVVVALVAWGAMSRIASNQKKETASEAETTAVLSETETEETAETEPETPEETEETQPETVPVTHTAALLAGDPGELLNGLNPVTVVSSEASSNIEHSLTPHDVTRIFDGDEYTNWQEGAEGDGTGETVRAVFDGPHRIRLISFCLGHWANDDYYQGNCRPKTIKITAGDFEQSITFPDEMKVNWVEITEPVEADSIQFTMEEIYAGDSWEDMVISEITMYEQPA